MRPRGLKKGWLAQRVKRLKRKWSFKYAASPTNATKCHYTKEFNEQVVRLCALAMLSNGRAGNIVRTTLKKKNELMEAKRAKEATTEEA